MPHLLKILTHKYKINTTKSKLRQDQKYIHKQPSEIYQTLIFKRTPHLAIFPKVNSVKRYPLIFLFTLYCQNTASATSPKSKDFTSYLYPSHKKFVMHRYNILRSTNNLNFHRSIQYDDIYNYYRK